MSVVLARRYCNALFALCLDENVLDDVGKNLDALREMLVEGSDLHTLFNNPLIASSDKEQVLKALFAKNMISKLLYSFLVVLNKGNRLPLFELICGEMDKMIAEHRGEIRGTAYFACEVSSSFVKEVEDVLAKKIEKNVQLTSQIDEDLIGGFRVSLGNSLYDASVRGRLRKLKDAMLTGSR